MEREGGRWTGEGERLGYGREIGEDIGDRESEGWKGIEREKETEGGRESGRKVEE